MKSADTWLKASLAVLISCSALFFFSYPASDVDLWGHLYFGKEIIAHQALPDVNGYAYTAPDYPWINHEWLAEVVFFLVYHALGSRGLILLKLAVAVSSVLLLDLVIRRRVPSGSVRAVVLVWVMGLLSPGFNVRPQIFTYLLLAVLCLILDRHRSGTRHALYAAVPLFALWVNLHGGVLAGVVVLAVDSAFCAAGAIARRATAAATVMREVALPAALAVAALLANPYGTALPSFLLRDVTLDRPLIVEWLPILLLDASFLWFKSALALLAFAVVRWKWLRRSDVVLVVLAAAATLQHRRHLPIFAVLAAPLIAEALDRVRAGLFERGRLFSDAARRNAAKGVLAAAALALALFEATWTVGVHSEHDFRIAVDPLEIPVQAADFLGRNEITGNLALPFEWGEYFIWKLHPAIRVSIDGRYTTAYPVKVIEAAWGWAGAQGGWRAFVRDYPSDIALAPRDWPVAAGLQGEPGWIQIYEDPLAVIFVRDTPSQQELLARFRAGRLVPPGPPAVHFPG